MGTFRAGGCPWAVALEYGAEMFVSAFQTRKNRRRSIGRAVTRCSKSFMPYAGGTSSAPRESRVEVRNVVYLAHIRICHKALILGLGIRL